MVAIAIALGLALSPGQLTEPSIPFTIERGPTRTSGPLTSIRVDVSGEFAELPALEILQLVSTPDDPSRWRLFARRLAQTDEGLDLGGQPGVQSLLVIRNPRGPGYGLYGPFVWPSTSTALTLAPVGARTVRARAPAREALTSGRWIPADSTAGSSADCRSISASALECIGIPAGESGVILAEDSSGALWSAPAPRPDRRLTIQDLVFETSSWGVLFNLAVSEGSREAGQLEASMWQSRQSRTTRSTRLLLMPLFGYRLVWVTQAALWIAGSVPQDDALLEIGGSGLVATRIPLGALRLNPRDVPVSLTLNRSSEIAGRVVTGDGRAIPRVTVTVSEFVNDDGGVAQSADGSRFRRRVDEVVTDDEGLFVVDGLEQRDYEWLAVHPVLGRARIVGRPVSPMHLTLSAERTVVGRVTSRGVPVAGVPVMILPVLEGLAASADPLERIGQESRSDATGRFVLAVPSRAGGDVRIGSNATGIVRLRFGAAGGRATIDLGDVELPDRALVRVELDRHDDCDISAVGPLGHVGMQIVGAIREDAGIWRIEPPEHGRWSLVVTCSGNVVAVEPATFELKRDADAGDLTVRVISIER